MMVSRSNIENIKKNHLFRSIPTNFRDASFRIKYEAEGFVKVDTTIPYTKSITLPVYRNDDLALIQGYVYEEGTEPPEGIEGVKVSIPCCSAYSEASGKFKLPVPFEYQRRRQRLKLFKEEFHQRSTTEPIHKGIDI